METLTYSYEDGVKRISDGLRTYERAPIDIKPFSLIMRVSPTDLDFLAKYKTVTCNVTRGHIVERFGTIWKIEEQLTHKNFYVFHKELFVCKRYCVFSAMSNGVRSLYHVARFSTYANEWQPVSPTFKTFAEAKSWCTKRCIHFLIKDL